MRGAFGSIFFTSEQVCFGRRWMVFVVSYWARFGCIILVSGCVCVAVANIWGSVGGESMC